MQSTNYFDEVKSKDTLSYTYINGETIIERDLTELSLIGCNINFCSFVNVIMKSSDVDGAILNNCTFHNSDWSYTDFCSINVSNSMFINIDFGMSTMNNCKFDNCKFINCNFNHIAMNSNIYEDCQFVDIELLQSSTYLNYYNKCIFSRCNYNGNMYYNMFIDCQFQETTFEIKLFSSNYWGTYNNFEAIGFDPIEQKSCQNQTLGHRLPINYVTLKLNLEKDFDNSMLQYIIVINKLLENDIFIRDEQINFIYNILNYLIDNELISPVTCVQMLSIIEYMYNAFDNSEAFRKCEKMLNLLLNKLHLIYQKIGQEISYSPQNTGNELNVIKIVFEQEPTIEICTLINEIKKNLNIDAPDAIRIKTEKGSFLEWIQCYDSVLGCLQLFVNVLGLGISVYGLHKNKKETNVSNDNLEISKFEQKELLKIVTNTLNKQQFNPEVNTTLQVIIKNDVVAKNNFRGYKKSNVRSIEIISENN